MAAQHQAESARMAALHQAESARMAEQLQAESARMAEQRQAESARMAAYLQAESVRLLAESRRRAEEMSAESARRAESERRAGAGRRLLAAAELVGRPAPSADAAETALREWQRDEALAGPRRDQRARDEAELAGLVRGRSVADLEADARRTQERADRLGERAGLSTVDSAGEAAGTPAEAELADDLDRLRDDARAAAQVAGTAETSLREWLADVEPVADAEEAVARSEAELARVRALDATLSLTRGFLQQAEQTAHRTIAPRLAAAVRQWLPDATDGRYTEVIVDPESLRVQVRGPAGRWRDAGRLSHGTSEQIYLMLRIALAEHLTRPGTRCPLLLDDVTVHADPERTERLLDLLLTAAADRQVILFTQQEQVVAWARQRLAGPRNSVVELTELAPV
jgi:DNA repair exonuclease SbcCD ATPase subunit